MTYFQIYFFGQLLSLFLTAGDLGSDCVSSDGCLVNNSVCQDDICTCANGLTEYNGKCVQGKLAPNTNTIDRRLYLFQCPYVHYVLLRLK